MYNKIITAAIVIILISSCNGDEKNNSKTNTTAETISAIKANMQSENIDYVADGVTMKGFVAYNADTTKLKPVVLILPEWWGIADYTRGRAKQLAALGYLAFAVDMYGNGKTAETPDEAGKLATPFYTKIGRAHV